MLLQTRHLPPERDLINTLWGYPKGIKMEPGSRNIVPVLVWMGRCATQVQVSCLRGIDWDLMGENKLKVLSEVRTITIIIWYRDEKLRRIY
jgi:hypothetical protein